MKTSSSGALSEDRTWPLSDLGFDLTPYSEQQILYYATTRLKSNLARCVLLEGATDPAGLKQTHNDVVLSGSVKHVEPGIFAVPFRACPCLPRPTCRHGLPRRDGCRLRGQSHRITLCWWNPANLVARIDEWKSFVPSPSVIRATTLDRRRILHQCQCPQLFAGPSRRQGGAIIVFVPGTTRLVSQSGATTTTRPYKTFDSNISTVLVLYSREPSLLGAGGNISLSLTGAALNSWRG
jgi:hypothetical protein